MSDRYANASGEGTDASDRGGADRSGGHAASGEDAPDQRRVSSTYRIYESDDPYTLLLDLERTAWVWVDVSETTEIAKTFFDALSGNVVEATVEGHPDTDDPWTVVDVSVVDDSRLWDVVSNEYVPAVADEAWEDRQQTHNGLEGRVTITDDDGTITAVFDAMTNDEETFDGRTVWEAYQDRDFVPEPWFDDEDNPLPGGAHDVIVLNPTERPYDVIASFPAGSPEFPQFAAHLDREVIERGDRVTGRVRVYSLLEDPPVDLLGLDETTGAVYGRRAETTDGDPFAGVELGNVVEVEMSADADESGARRVFSADVVRDDRIWVERVAGAAPAFLDTEWRQCGRDAVAVWRDENDAPTAEFSLGTNEDIKPFWERFQDGRQSFETDFEASEMEYLDEVGAVSLVDFADQPFTLYAAFRSSDVLEQFQWQVAGADGEGNGGATDDRHAEETGHESSGDGDREPTATDDPSPSGDAGGQTGAFDDLDTADLEYDWSRSTGVTFDDVGGMDEVKAELHRDVLRPLTVDRERAEAFGIPLQNVLLYGPPGTGKTYLAKALANEAGVPFVLLSGSDVTSRWINASSERINTLFTEAEVLAERAGGALIFLDELDAVLTAREGGSSAHAEDRKVVNEFLSHLQDVSEQGVVFVGATNKREDLDEAAIRSGRIDKEIHVGLPEEPARRAIFTAQLDDRPTDLSEATLEAVAADTDGLNAADIAAVVNDAARRALFVREGDAISDDDLRDAVDDWETAAEDAEAGGSGPVDGDSYRM